MTEIDKQLLLQDLCTRLPYRPYVWNAGKGTSELTIGNTYFINLLYGSGDYPDSPLKPYLRPMSSMTNEEMKSMPKPFKLQPNGRISSYDVDFALEVVHYEAVELTEWLNSHHFDYRGLIEKGLALPAPEGMYNTK